MTLKRRHYSEKELNNLFGPSALQRLVQALVSVGLGFLLVHLFYNWLGIKAGIYYLNGSIDFDTYDVLIILFLVTCGVAGWVKGQPVTDRLWEEIHNWNWWVWRNW